MRVATTTLARVIARLRVLRAIVRIRAPPARIEILPPDAFSVLRFERRQPDGSKNRED
jgi:hypothetical protein